MDQMDVSFDLRIFIDKWVIAALVLRVSHASSINIKISYNSWLTHYLVDYAQAQLPIQILVSYACACVP